MTDLLIVVGARPNFMKAAAVVRAAESAGLDCCLLHTGQHYDRDLSQVFFDELGMDAPDVHLGTNTGTHTEQTARIMLAFEPHLDRIRPRVVVVVGDVNSTLACALVAVKAHYPVAHVEAGLRSFDPAMPEEVNRRLCDHLSTYLYTPSRDADANLAREGIPVNRVCFVGNTMIDTLLRLRDRAREQHMPARLGLRRQQYAVATLHRPENVDDPESLRRLLAALEEVGRALPVVFPVHPRTRERIAALGADRGRERSGLVLHGPLGYLDFLGLVADARLVLTDSGGVQEETTVLGVPCLTLRENTERPVTVATGTNTVVGRDPDRIARAAATVLAAPSPAARMPEGWDGRAGERIVDHLLGELRRSSGDPVPRAGGQPVASAGRTACVTCGTPIRDSGRWYADGVGRLLPYCPICAAIEFQAP